MSAVEVGQLLAVKHQAVRLWARRGLLASSQQASGDGSLRFLRDDVDRFREAFMLGGEVAERAGTPGCGTSVRHLAFLGVDPVSGPRIDGCDATLFRRADVTPEVLVSIARHRAGDDLPLQAQRARCSSQVGKAIAVLTARSGPGTRRVNNRLEDPTTGRITQVISGRRHSIGGTFRFRLNRESLDRLLAARDAYVALVPDQGGEFVHAPVADVLAFATPDRQALGLRFDPLGTPLDLAGHAVSLEAGSAR
jgi:hypothetical protein